MPGVPRPVVPAAPPAELLSLRAAVDGVLGLDLTGLPAAVALAHTRAVLVEAQRVHAAALSAVAELEERQLYALDGAGSTRSWLAQQPAGRTGLAGEASRLGRRPLLRAAVEAGSVGASTADQVASALEKLPGQVPEDQLVGVLRYALPALLVDRGVDPQLLASLADEALSAVGMSPADRLEPACVLLAQHLPPTTLAAELRMLMDALLPEQLADEIRAAWLEQRVHITKRRGLGYDFRIRVDDTLGPLVESALLSRLPKDDASALAVLSALADGADLPASIHAGRAARGTAEDETETRTETGTDVDADATAAEAGAEPLGPPVGKRGGPAGTARDLLGTAGPGQPLVPAPAWTDPPVEGTPILTRDQKLVVALATLIADLSAVAPGTGRRQPVSLLVVTTLDALHGAPGALPAQLDTPHGSVPLSAPAVQRLGCGATAPCGPARCGREPGRSVRRAPPCHPTRATGPAGPVGESLRRQRLHPTRRHPAPRRALVEDPPHPARRPRPDLRAPPPRRPRRPAHGAAARRPTHRRPGLGRPAPPRRLTGP